MALAQARGPGARYLVRRCVRGWALGLVLVGAVASSADAQTEESRVLREAAALESVGDYEGAERALKRVLDGSPTSPGALFALERVLRAQGRVEEVLPYADRFLEAAPASTGPRYLKLRVLVEVDSLEAVRAEGEDWIHQDPAAVEPYREVARILGEVLGRDVAVEVLEEGMRSAERGYDLALDLGDLFFEDRAFDRAGRAWAQAVGPDGENGPAVLRRVSRLEGERAAVLEPMLASLGGAQQPSGRLRVATQLALEGGLEDETIRLAAEASAGLDPAGRRAFLAELARRAEERRVDPVTLWAVQALRATAEVESEIRSLDRRIGDVALLVGDTATALASWQAAAAGLPQGSPERRRTLAQVLRLEAEMRPLDRAAISSDLEAFKEEFPDASELDALAASVSVRLQSEGDLAGAVVALQGVHGPASSLERAYLILAGGDPAKAREDLLSALAGLPAGQATDVIALVALLDRSSPAGQRVAALATVLAHRGSAAEAVAEVEAGRSGLPDPEQAGLLALAGRIASGHGLADQAEAAWTTLIDDFPDAPETPEAALSLATSRAARPGGREEAIALLEDLIVTRPNSPIVPAARRELDRIRSQGSRP